MRRGSGGHRFQHTDLFQKGDVAVELAVGQAEQISQLVFGCCQRPRLAQRQRFGQIEDDVAPPPCNGWVR